MRSGIRCLVLAFGLALAAPSCAHEATSKGVTVADPWVRANPGGSTLTAAFMELRADGQTADTLVGVSTSAAARSEVHTHVMEGEVMKMRRVEALELKAGESHILKPSGDHIMLLDLKAPLKEGDLVKLTLTFEKAGNIEIEATVEPPGAMGPHGMDHRPGTDEQDIGGEHHHH